MVRAKFKCTEKAEREGFPHTYGLKFSAVTGGTQENITFFKFTPYGDINVSVVSEETAKQFTVGKEYYVDFNEA